MFSSLAGYRTYILAALAIASAWVACAVGDIPTQDAIAATFAALSTCTIRAGITKEIAKTTLPIFICMLALAGCSTSGPSDQLAGQAPVRGTSAAFNSTATTESAASLRDMLGNASEGVEIPLMNKDGTLALDSAGNPVLIRVGRGLRDVNLFFGETTITAETTVSGSQTGAEQGNTPTNTANPNVNPNVSGLPGK